MLPFFAIVVHNFPHFFEDYVLTILFAKRFQQILSAVLLLFQLDSGIFEISSELSEIVSNSLTRL